MSTKSSPTITTIPCILYAILARESDWAVIFRSGPKRRVQLIRWNTKTDKFDHGQWLKHKVFERQANLSPCGDKLICMSTYYRKAYRELHRHLGPILIVSRPPYFTAAAIITVSQSQDSGYFQTKAGQSNTWTNNRRYTLINSETGEEDILGELSWADIDKNNDLLFAKDGQLYRLKPQWKTAAPFDLNQAKLLYDFRLSQFTELEAPSWALEWD